MLGIGRKNTAFKVLNIKSCHILSFGLKNAGYTSEKNSQTCRPFPDLDRSK